MNVIYPLCSSSKGNAIFVGSRTNGVLFDCGIGIRNLTHALKLNNISLSAVRAVFVTHEHSDHISGLAKFTDLVPAAIYGNVPTLQAVISKGAVGRKTALKEIDKRPAEISGMEVRAFRTSHDSADSMGYHVTFADGKRFCLCTDLGYVSDEVDAMLSDSDLVLLESNYEEEMLLAGSYPWPLKQRIRGDRGHLANKDCAAEISKLTKLGVRRFILGHLSQENNRPEIALACSTEQLVLDGLKPVRDFELMVAPRMTNGKLVEL